MTTNLLDETLADIRRFGLNPNAIEWVGTNYERMSWHRFATLAKDINYTNGIRYESINGNLMIVWGDYWMERSSIGYRGFWVFKHTPRMPNTMVDEMGLVNYYSE